jgi:dTDP-4-amino-4,6-dideoxy-D-glucose acyltransferase
LSKNVTFTRGFVLGRADLTSSINPLARVFVTARIADSVEKLTMGENSFIGDFCFVSVPSLFLGRGSQINSGTRIIGNAPVFIAENSVIGYGCTVLTSSDQSNGEYMNDASPESKREIRNGPVMMGERVFIGSHSIIMPDVSIAHRVVVRAFSYVNRSLVSQYGLYGGQPAQFLHTRSIGRKAQNKPENT